MHTCMILWFNMHGIRLSFIRSSFSVPQMMQLILTSPTLTLAKLSSEYLAPTTISSSTMKIWWQVPQVEEIQSLISSKNPHTMPSRSLQTATLLSMLPELYMGRAVSLKETMRLRCHWHRPRTTARSPAATKTQSLDQITCRLYQVSILYYTIYHRF